MLKVFKTNNKAPFVVHLSLLLTLNTSSEAVSEYMVKVNNRNTRTSCEICSKITIKTQKRRYCRHSDVFVVNIKRVSHLFLVFILLTLNR